MATTSLNNRKSIQRVCSAPVFCSVFIYRLNVNFERPRQESGENLRYLHDYDVHKQAERELNKENDTRVYCTSSAAKRLTLLYAKLPQLSRCVSVAVSSDDSWGQNSHRRGAREDRQEEVMDVYMRLLHKPKKEDFSKENVDTAFGS
ncbi:hypothetical protein JOB18_021967 [Solea senegalensis]|uniref:Uncharacterized protein n=1 Tax=Solea senegalensis TaxID=28829 RepID=A0AAV6PJM3_SOLSE|nr:hypothetical protein JOB18_021967 [Solea senegalensis]